MGCGAFCLLLLVSLHVSYVKQVATLGLTSKTFKKNLKTQKSKKDRWPEPSKRRQKGSLKHAQPTGPKKKVKASPSCGRRQSHPQPF